MLGLRKRNVIAREDNVIFRDCRIIDQKVLELKRDKLAFIIVQVKFGRDTIYQLRWEWILSGSIHFFEMRLNKGAREKTLETYCLFYYTQ